jgi:hypothetical protein
MPLIPDSEEHNAHYAAIGRIAASWATLDHEIQFRIWRIANLDTVVGPCITSQIGITSRLMDCLIAIRQIRGGTPEEHIKLKTLAGKIGYKQRRRNRFVHDPWFLFRDEKGEIVSWRMELSASKTIVAGPIEETKDNIEKLLRDINMLISSLKEILPLNKLGKPPSP